MLGLARHNLRKAIGSFVSFGIVMIITAVILNTALVLMGQTSPAYDSLFDDLNTADLSAAVPEQLAYEGLEEDILALEGVKDTEQHQALFAQAGLQEFQGSEFVMNTYFYRFSDDRTLSAHRVEDEGSSAGGLEVYIPIYLSEMGGYKTGDKMEYKVEGETYTFTVLGVITEMQYGNYGTGFIGLYLTDSAFDELKGSEGFTQVSEYLIETDSDSDIAGVKTEVSRLLKDKSVPTLSLLDRETAKNSRTMVSTTIVLFLTVFALLVLLVSIFLARFRIKNTIDEEINEMGVLKGVGYTSRLLILSQVIPYGAVCAGGLIAGTALSYGLIPLLARILAVQSGFSYEPEFDISAACITVFTILAAVLLFTVLAAKKIRRLEPINAIRGMDPTRKAPKNIFPLDRGNAPVGLGLMMKQAGTSAGRNLLLFAVTFVMMILLTFTGALLYNVNIRPDNFMTTLSEEMPDIRVKSDEEHFESLKSELSDRGISFIGYGTVQTEYSEGSIPAIVCEDFGRLKNDICYYGSHPAAAGEIALGSALEKDYAIGDTFKLSLNGETQSYTVTGYIQSVNNNGLIAELTDEGYAELSDTPLCSLNLYMEEGADIEGFVKTLEDSQNVVSVANAAKENESVQRLYSSLITVVAAILFIVTVLIVLLILYVLMKSMITSLKTDFGIYKAMGFTSRQLILQTVGSITPVVLGGALLSAVLGIFYLPVMFDGIFGVIGAIKNNFEIPVAVLLIMALLITLVNVVIGALLCRPIGRITAYSLIKE